MLLEKHGDSSLGRGVYRITYVNGYVYTGSFVNRKNHVIGETYFGSSALAKQWGWRIPGNIEVSKDHIDKIEVWYVFDNLRVEKRFIEWGWRKYGVHKSLMKYEHLSHYKQGLSLNHHSNSCEHLKQRSIRLKVKDTEGYKNRRTYRATKESASKGVRTKINKGISIITIETVKKGREALRSNPDILRKNVAKTTECHDKSVYTRIRNDSYRIGSIKAAKTISGKPHFVEVPVLCYDIQNNLIGKFESIKSAESYFDSIGKHITRATMSQGLKRCSGSYVYKNEFIFKYNSLQ